MSDIPEFKPYNPAEPFIKMKLEGSILDKLAEAGIPAMRALKYFHENPEGKATTFFSMLADDFVPFKYQIQSGEATPSSLAKEAILMAMPTREGKAAERSMYQPRDPNKGPIELSNRSIEADEGLRNAGSLLNELTSNDDPYNGGPQTIMYEDIPFDPYPTSEIIDLPEVRRYANEEMGWTDYNTWLNDMAEALEDADYDYMQHALEPDEAARYKAAGEEFRNAINQADYNDIIIGNGTPLAIKSAQDLANNIETGNIKPSRNQLRSVFNGQSMESFLKDYIESNGYSITQQDLKNIVSTYTPQEILSYDPAVVGLYEQMESAVANNPGNANEIRRAFRNMLDDLEAINELE